MSTSYSVPINAFLKRVEKDKDFFHYFGVSDEYALEIAKDRAKTYMWEAIGRLMLECQPDVDFTDADEATELFNFDWSATEKLLIPSLMYEYYLDRDIAYLKLQNVNYTATDLRVLDPSNARSSFMEMYGYVCAYNKQMLEEYRCRDRLSGALKGINYTVDNADSN